MNLERFLTYARPEWSETEISSVLRRLQSVGIESAPRLMSLLSNNTLNEVISSAPGRPFSPETLDAWKTISSLRERIEEGELYRLRNEATALEAQITRKIVKLATISKSVKELQEIYPHPMECTPTVSKEKLGANDVAQMVHNPSPNYPASKAQGNGSLNPKSKPTFRITSFNGCWMSANPDPRQSERVYPRQTGACALSTPQAKAPTVATEPCRPAMSTESGASASPNPRLSTKGAPESLRPFTLASQCPSNMVASPNPRPRRQSPHWSGDSDLPEPRLSPNLATTHFVSPSASPMPQRNLNPIPNAIPKPSQPDVATFHASMAPTRPLPVAPRPPNVPRLWQAPGTVLESSNEERQRMCDASPTFGETCGARAGMQERRMGAFLGSKRRKSDILLEQTNRQDAIARARSRVSESSFLKDSQSPLRRARRAAVSSSVFGHTRSETRFDSVQTDLNSLLKSMHRIRWKEVDVSIEVKKDLESAKAHVFQRLLSARRASATDRATKIKQLVFQWHPDKQPLDSRFFATHVFQYMQSLREKLGI